MVAKGIGRWEKKKKKNEKECWLIQRPGFEGKKIAETEGKCANAGKNFFVGLTFSSSWLACCCGAFHLPRRACFVLGGGGGGHISQDRY